MEDIMEIKETAEYLQCGEQSLRRKIKSKEIPCRYIGGKYIFSKMALTLWLAGADSEIIVNSLLRRK